MLDKKELAQHLGISISMVNKLIAKGLPHIKVGSAVRFELEEVMKWLKEGGK